MVLPNITKPYLIRAIYECCIDNNFTPNLRIKLTPELDWLRQYAEDDEVTIGIGTNSVVDFLVTNDQISFKARFSGVSKTLEIPMGIVSSIFAKESSVGLTFTIEETTKPINNKSVNLKGQTTRTNKPTLRIIK